MCATCDMCRGKYHPFGDQSMHPTRPNYVGVKKEQYVLDVIKPCPDAYSRSTVLLEQMAKGSTTNLNQGGWDALVCRNPTPPSRLGSRVLPTVPPLEG
jgi:hypothetical protein